MCLLPRAVDWWWSTAAVASRTTATSGRGSQREYEVAVGRAYCAEFVQALRRAQTEPFCRVDGDGTAGGASARIREFADAMLQLSIATATATERGDSSG